MIESKADGVFVLRDGQDEEWRVEFNGGIIAASWRQRGPAKAHLDLLARGAVRPVYADGRAPNRGPT